MMCTCVTQFEAEGGIPLSEVLDRCIELCNIHNKVLPEYKQQLIIARADADCNGRLNYEEFVQLVCHPLCYLSILDLYNNLEKAVMGVLKILKFLYRGLFIAVHGYMRISILN